MSMLVGAARAGSPYLALNKSTLESCTNISPFAHWQRRGMAKRSTLFPPPEYKQKQERDKGGNVIREQKEKSLGAFRAFPESALPSIDIFSPERRTVLQLPAFTPTDAMIGKATEFPDIPNDPARIYGLPKKMLLEFRILSRPCSVVRQITVDTVQRLDQAKNTSSLENRAVLTGRAGCGKSFLMLQLVKHCIMNDWVVIYIPRAVKLVDSTTPYEYDLRTRTYKQPTFAFQTLRRMLDANQAKLSTLTTHEKHVFDKREVPLNTTLADLIGLALRERPLAPIVLDTVMSELSHQTRHPVLFAVDDFQALYCRTAYRDPHFVPIRPFHLSLPRLIMEFASGKRSFARGAFLGSITNSDTNYKLPIELKDALELPHEHFKSPYDKRSRTLLEYTTGLKPIHVPEQLSVVEAASLFEIWKDDKALLSSFYDEAFLSKYTESSGNARDFVWKGLLRSLET